VLTGMANLPSSQQAILDSLARQGGEQPVSAQCTTIASLLDRELIEYTGRGAVYRLTEAGRAQAKDGPPRGGVR
jgi:hypothetical protein